MAIEDLVRRLNGMCDEQPFQTGWFLKDLRSGETANRLGDVVVPSASTRKIAILMAALRAVHRGRFRLDQPVTLTEKYQNTTSGTFQHFLTPFTLRFRDLLVMMIIVSDNVSTGTVTEMVGMDDINEFSRSVGMKGTAHRHGFPPGNLPRNHPVDAVNATTPNDVGLLLDLVLQGTQSEAAAARLGVTPELCRLGLDILSWQKLQQRLPFLLPQGTKVAHKTGTGVDKRNNNDAGIIFQGDKPLFILTVYTEHVPVAMPDGMPGFNSAGLHIARLCRACYDALAEREGFFFQKIE